MPERKSILITGSLGLIGSQAVEQYAQEGWEIHGIDNNHREQYFGKAGSNRPNQKRLGKTTPQYQHHEADIRDHSRIEYLFQKIKPNAIIHTAGQPSHLWGFEHPTTDFLVNAFGTLTLLEATKNHCPESPFVFFSTNKVYGDRINQIPLKEKETRWEFSQPEHQHGINEEFPIDQSQHTPFGVSKLSADLLVQEYGKSFQLKTCCLRCGCLTGPHQSGVEAHGFLSHMIRCHQKEEPYRIEGYKGKQVRDLLHSRDVVTLTQEILKNPPSGEVYNLGGGRENSTSLLELITLIQEYTGKVFHYEVNQTPRTADHICYYTDLRKTKKHFPAWDVQISIKEILEEMLTRIKP